MPLLQLNIYSKDFSGKGLVTHTTTWDLWPSRTDSHSVFRNISHILFRITV
jgi:hypothetical protein